MIAEKKVKKFVKYLKNVLKVTENVDSSKFTDSEVLEIFRTCASCGEEVISASEQMHTILEFDKSEKIFEILCEIAEPVLQQHNKDDEEDEDEHDCDNPECDNYYGSEQ